MAFMNDSPGRSFRTATKESHELSIGRQPKKKRKFNQTQSQKRGILMKRITADVTHAITHNFEVILPTNQMKIDAFRFGELTAEWFIS